MNVDGDLVAVLLTAAEAKKKSFAHKANDHIYGSLVQLSYDMTFFLAIEKAKMSDLPDGDAHQAWLNLIDRYAPTTITSEVDLRREFTGSTLGTQTPDESIAELEHVRQHLRECPNAQPITDQEIILQVLDNLPSDYRLNVTILEAQHREGTLSLCAKNDKKDVAFVSSCYKDTCHNCGIQWHKAHDCR